MSSGFTLTIPAYRFNDIETDASDLVIFYPFFNDKIPEIIERRVTDLDCMNYVPIYWTVNTYLDSIEHRSSSIAPTMKLLDFVGHFDEYMSNYTEPQPSCADFIQIIGTLFDLIEDNPGILTAPIHDQFYARLYHMLMHEEQIHSSGFSSYRGFARDDVC